ncbi:MAG TPA: glutamine amidotransferase [Pirellulaceae bacterium]|nr:glutamine amidotransferase [Pirellulaceae bacterium]
MIEWSLNPIFNSYGVVAALMAGVALLLLVTPEFGRMTKLRKGALIAARVGVLLLLLLAMLRPTRIYSTTKQQTAVLMLMLDQSRSMTLPSTVEGKSRWQEQRETLLKIQDQLADLSKDFDLRLYSYDNQLHPLQLSAGKIELPDEPTGDLTDIGTTLHEAVQRELGKRLMGTILLGDGAQTAFSPQVELPEAGRELARLEYPLYTVVFGPTGDAAQARDVSIENMPEQYTVFVKNELIVKGALRVRGYVNQAIPVELIADYPSGEKSLVATVEVTAREDNQLLPVEMSFVPPEPGQYQLTLRAAGQPGERVTRNNELSAFVTALEGGLRVLYLYGDLLGEQRLLRRSINLSPDIQLDDIYVDPKNRERWPINLDDELSFANLDVLLLESVDSSALGEANLQGIATLTERGKGLMMLGGYNSFGPGGYRETPLADVLPIEMGRFERQDIALTSPISKDLHLWGELVPVPTGSHATTTLAPGIDNESVWKSLPPLEGANKFTDLKPRSRVLLETEAKQPLLVSGEYGSGRVLAFAGNSTIRWWQQGRQTEHRRFWRQVILWLARRDDLDQNDVWIKLAQRRFNPGARVTFTAGAKSAVGDFIRDATFAAELVSEDGTRQTLRLSQDDEAMSGAIEEVKQPGDYLVELTVSRQGKQLGTTRANFQVLDRDIELSTPAAGHEQMAQLAALTKESGGKPLAPEQLPGLLRELKERREELQVEIQVKWRLGDTALDAWLFVLAVVSCLTLEWVLRKHWGLV